MALADYNGQLQMNKDISFVIDCHKDEVLGNFSKLKILESLVTQIYFLSQYSSLTQLP